MLYAVGVVVVTIVLFGILYPLLVIDWSRTSLLLGVINVTIMVILNFFLVDGLMSETLAERMPPRVLPELDPVSAMPAESRAIVYCPIRLRSESELSFIDTCLIPSMEGNHESWAKWVVVSGSEPEMQSRESARIRELQARFGSDRVSYFHRHSCMRNWERKRGGYMQFMLWLQQGACADGLLKKDPRFPSIPSGCVFDELPPDPAMLRGAEYLLMSDSDTLWPRDSMRRLVGKLLHPANREYVILQTDIRPYNGNESVLNSAYSFFKDLFSRRGEGFWLIYRHLTFFGHGAVWRIDRFLDCMAGRMREGFLSHDIIEGFFARAALVTDVVTMEEWPPNLYLLEKQQFRWWLGTWMAGLFFGTKVPDETGRYVKNPISWTHKYLLARIFSTYTNPPLIVLYVLTAAAVAYRSGPALFYLAGLLYFWFGRNIVWNRGWPFLRLCLRHLAVVGVLTPVLTLMTGLFVIRSLGTTVWYRWILRRPVKHGWTVQGSLSKPTPDDVVRKLGHLVVPGMLLGLFGTAYVFATGAFFAAMFSVPLALTPLVLWITALPPEHLRWPNPGIQAMPTVRESVPES